MTDDERARIERLSRSIDLTLADAQDRIDRGETLPFECARAVVKVAKAAVELCHAHPDALTAARAEAIEEAAKLLDAERERCLKARDDEWAKTSTPKSDTDMQTRCGWTVRASGMKEIAAAIRALPAARRGQ